LSVKLGKAPLWVLQNYTIPQAILVYNRIVEGQVEYLEVQAGIIWSMAMGKYKRKKKIPVTDYRSLKSLGVLKEV
jgi:hypothetical protein